MRLRSFQEMRAAVKHTAQVRLVVAGGESREIAKAVEQLMSDGLVSEALVTGNLVRMGAHFSSRWSEGLNFIEAKDPTACAQVAVAAIHEDRGNVLMKGHIDSKTYLRAVVDRGAGLRQGKVLSNVTVAEMPGLDRLLAATDNGIVPEPDLDQKRQIVLNTIRLFRGLGIAPVRVAAICATEKVSETLPATGHAAALAAQARDGRLVGFKLGGPMGYDVAVSRAAAQLKGLASLPAAGAADLLLFSNIDAANAVVKSWKHHGQAKTGSIVLGARVPVLLNSRSDTAEARVNAVLLAAAVLSGGE